MRHHVAFRKFSRTTAHRISMFRNMATSLVLGEQCETTVQKAKDLRRVVEPLITLAREDTLAARRRAYSFLKSKQAVHKLFAELGPRFKARPGGYTRVIRTRVRPGDAAEMAIIQFVEDTAKAAPKKKAAGSTRKRATKNTPAAEEKAAAE